MKRYLSTSSLCAAAVVGALAVPLLLDAPAWAQQPQQRRRLPRIAETAQRIDEDPIDQRIVGRVRTLLPVADGIERMHRHGRVRGANTGVGRQVMA